MLDQSQRASILQLHRQGHSRRHIARLVGVSRGAVGEVIRSGSVEVPKLDRPEKAAPHRETILELYERCKGNLVRVHEELGVAGTAISYPALTAFCRRQGIGQAEKIPAGQYTFEPGEEMQHDTSPHRITLAGNSRKIQTASLVLCYSRLLYFQFSPTFTRFDCKTFLTDAFLYMGGVAGRCMIDNTHVVVLRGTGREMVPVPEMSAFSDRYGFTFRAHEKGDANRSARVERPFAFIEGNFLAGRSFETFQDANRQAAAWCDQVNAAQKRHLHASPRELFAIEKARLRPLPSWVPPVYALHHRIVDVEGYVSVHTNRYSVPARMIGHRVEVRQTRDQIEVFDGPRLVATHDRVIDPVGRRVTLPEHRPPRGQGPGRHEPLPEEATLQESVPEIAEYVAALKKRAQGRGTLALRRLLQIVREYPRAAVLEAVRTAATYGLYDLERLESLVLKAIAQEYFVLPDDTEET